MPEPLFLKLELRVEDKEASGEEDREEGEEDLSFNGAVDESRSFEGILDCDPVEGNEGIYAKQ